MERIGGTVERTPLRSKNRCCRPRALRYSRRDYLAIWH